MPCLDISWVYHPEPGRAKGTKTNPIGYPLMVFDSDPNLAKGDRKKIRYEDQEFYIDFDALVVNLSEYQEDNMHIFSYVFEVEDRELTLQIAEIIRNANPDMFEENNSSV